MKNIGELVLGSRGMERDLVWLGEPEVAGGYLELPEGLGFGVEVNKEMI